MSDLYNPIRAVNGRTVKSPSSYKFIVSDVSAAKAGRTEDSVMHKMKVAQKVKIQLEWKYLTTKEISQLLQAFNPEYFTVTYLDAKTGGYETKKFYVGDRESPMYNGKLGLWESLSFDIIEV